VATDLLLPYEATGACNVGSCGQDWPAFQWAL
jgi:hypothetical protein